MSSSENTTNVPPEMLRTFGSLLTELQDRSSCCYTITIQQHGKSEPLKIQPFEERTKFFIYDMKEEYKSIEGEYQSFADVKRAVWSLSNPKYFIREISLDRGTIDEHQEGTVVVWYEMGKIAVSLNNGSCMPISFKGKKIII